MKRCILGLDRKSTKKRRNKKFGECLTTIRYNVIHMHVLFSHFVGALSFHTVGITLSTLPIRSNNQYCDSNGNPAVHVHDVVTDCSCALTEFLVSTLFGAFPVPSYVFFCSIPSLQ